MMDSQEDEELLVEKAREGDREAFDGLALRFRPRVELLLRSRPGVGEGDLADILQETFLRAFRALPTFRWRGPDSFLRWANGIALKIALEWAREGRRSAAEPIHGDLPGDAVSPSRALRRGERFERLQGAVDRLAPEHREVVRLVCLEGVPVKEVARRLGKTPNAVSKLLLRGSRRLRDLIGDTESLGLPLREVDWGGSDGD
jgi:RNA polymerase sigma-70 factor (ECF subfamily)